MLTEQPRIFRSETSTSQSPNLTPCARVKVEIADATAEAETIHLADKRQPVEVQPMAPAKSPSGKLKRLPYLRAPNLLRIHPTDVTHSEVISRSGSIPIAIQGAQRAGLPGTKRVLSLAVARFVRKRPTQPQILTFYIRCSLAE